ncbi:hypothetical protein CesoFtcFv8_027740 [Champsocephalus esox]|uniref:Uncharacterized protein n=1 Tax=Champsocephalus esox TaxID=159716 RepID=A0AAN7Y3J7_9TELE|nr:hypothetical protein CesoFtcFv8_027740 [Champsocephalus esox]
MSRGSKQLLLERDFVSAAPPLGARSPSAARRQYGSVERDTDPEGTLGLISFGCLCLGVSFSAEKNSACTWRCIGTKRGGRQVNVGGNQRLQVFVSE